MGKNISGKNIITNFMWKLGERISAQLITFVVSMVIARILDPEHYGAIALVMVFITIANIFVTSGFGNSLIQKKDPDDLDFSSVFFCNLAMSLILYIILFIASPMLARFYDMPILTPVFRVMGLRLIVGGINNVQHAYVSKNMMFKRFFWSTLGGTIISGVAGIVMAYMGFGIWALVAQYMINTTVDTIVLFVTVKWYPKLKFSFKRLKVLLSYSWKILFSELINKGYIELRSLIVGKVYSATDLSFYSKGQSFPKLVITNISTAIQSVLFPAMSNVQDDKERVKSISRHSIRINSYIILPLIIGLALVAKPFISLLLTDKWLPCVPYLQVYCLFYCLIPIQTANLQAIKALGRSDLYLKLEIIKKIVSFIALFISIPFGPFAIAASAVGCNIFAALINVIPNKKLLNYKYSEQFYDYFNGFIPLLSMVIVVWLISFLPLSSLLALILQITSGLLVYVLASWIFKVESFNYILNILKRKKKRN